MMFAKFTYSPCATPSSSVMRRVGGGVCCSSIGIEDGSTRRRRGVSGPMRRCRRSTAASEETSSSRDIAHAAGSVLQDVGVDHRGGAYFKLHHYPAVDSSPA